MWNFMLKSGYTYEVDNILEKPPQSRGGFFIGNLTAFNPLDSHPIYPSHPFGLPLWMCIPTNKTG